MLFSISSGDSSCCLLSFTPDSLSPPTGDVHSIYIMLIRIQHEMANSSQVYSVEPTEPVEALKALIEDTEGIPAGTDSPA